MNAITAEAILTPAGLKRNQVLLFNDPGTILEILPLHTYAGTPPRTLPGLLCPGFVNAHCHLELSHLKGLVPRHTGMVGFILALQKVRGQVEAEERAAAIRGAAREMWERGIQAVGDICNGTESLAAKRELPQMHWHNFIELFGSNPAQATAIFERGQALLTAFEGWAASLTPHAPYSVSQALKTLIYEAAATAGARMSIHLLESQEEVELFPSGEGPFLEFYRLIGQSFQGGGYADALAYLEAGLPTSLPGMIWVHNTEMDQGQLERLAGSHNWFCLCPLANLYIHDRLPQPGLFGSPGVRDRVCLGTDSLAGNDTLDILEEVKTLQSHWPEIPLSVFLQWATLNGAKALGFDETLGSFAPGKQPGMLHLYPYDAENHLLLPETVTTRII
jgi:cytosine/adenosine deaminase-related metal-dependent hydrolase